jgi:hypothetical protein
MARDDTQGAQRVDYGNKTGETGKSKEISSKPEQMIQGGKSNENGRGGPTGSERLYPKSKKVSLSADFNPLKDKKRGATDWAVGGV